MPPPSNEQDLKRRARRRLIGAVALTLLAVIVLPLLLEDEPPPASSLAVKMDVTSHTAAVKPASPIAPPQPLAGAQPAIQPKSGPGAEPDLAEPANPVPTKPQAPAPEPVKPEPAKPAPEKPAVKPAAAKPRVVKPDVAKPAPHVEHKPAAHAAFVVQLAALADAGKARALSAQASEAGLPAYTDTVGKLTRVRVGPFATREAAVAAAVKLAEHGMSGQVVAK